jgi:hypothetical protein
MWWVPEEAQLARLHWCWRFLPEVSEIQWPFCHGSKNKPSIVYAVLLLNSFWGTLCSTMREAWLWNSMWAPVLLGMSVLGDMISPGSLVCMAGSYSAYTGTQECHGHPWNNMWNAWHISAWHCDTMFPSLLFSSPFSNLPGYLQNYTNL